MCTFFILRLYFIFKDVVIPRPKIWVFAICIMFVIGSLCLEFMSTAAVLMGWTRPNVWYSMSSHLISFIINISVTGYYFRGLLSLVTAQATVEWIRCTMCNQHTNQHVNQGMNPLNRNHNVLKVPLLHKMATAHLDSPSDLDSERRRMTVMINERLIDVITKSTLLNFIGQISSCTLIGYISYQCAVIIEHQIPDIEERWFTALLRCIDGVINTVCMFLVFGYAAPYYDMGCKYCHCGMRKCCKSVAKNIVKQRREIGKEGIELRTFGERD